MKGTRFTLAACAGALLAVAALAPSPSLAASYPEKPIKVIVPHGAGGSTDITTRLVAEPFAKNLGQSVAVVNIKGGGTAIGAQEAARSAPDGYTLAATHVALLTSSAMGANKMGPSSLKPIAQVGFETQLIAVQSSSPMNSLEDFYAAVKKGSSPKQKLGISAGAANHFAFLRIMQPIDWDVLFVPTGGGGASLKALLGGSIDVGTFVVSEVIDQIRAGNIKALAVFGPNRHPDLPDVPTARESGYEIDVGLHYVWYAPKDTPDERIAVLADAMEKTIADTAFQKTMLERSIEPAFMRGPGLVTVLDERYETIKILAKEVVK